MQGQSFNIQSCPQFFTSFPPPIFTSVLLPIQQQQQQHQQQDQLSLYYVLQTQQQQQQQIQPQQLPFSQQQQLVYSPNIQGYSQGEIVPFMPTLGIQQKIIDPLVFGQLNMQNQLLNNGLCMQPIGQQQLTCLAPNFSQIQSKPCDFGFPQSLNSITTIPLLQSIQTDSNLLQNRPSIENSVQETTQGQIISQKIFEAPQQESSQVSQQQIQNKPSKFPILPSLIQTQPSVQLAIKNIDNMPSIKKSPPASSQSSSSSSSSCQNDDEDDDNNNMNPNKDSLIKSEEDSQNNNDENSKPQNIHANGSLPIRNNEDPYQTYKYPSQIQNQLRKQVLKRFFKSVPGYLDSLDSKISESIQDLDKAAVKSLCKYWSQFDNPARRTQLKNKEYRMLCSQLQVNSEIKPLGQKCLKEIFGKNNQFSDALRCIYQEFNKDANAFAHRKKNLGMQHKYVQASNRIFHDIFNNE